MMRTVLFVLTISFALPVFAQDTIDKDGRYISSQEEIEANLRMAESLRKPTFIRLRLVFIKRNSDETTDAAQPYKPGDPITFRLILNHFFNGPITIVDYNNPYTNLQLELLRDGDVVPYKKEAQPMIETAHTTPPIDGLRVSRLFPATDYVLPVRIYLSDWYETLPPDHYQLTVKRRFVRGGEWVQSELITFDIAPDKPDPDQRP